MELAFLSPSPMEIMVIAVIALIVLGPSRLPEAARSLGRGMREMRESFQGGGGDDDDRHRLDYDDEERLDDDEPLDEDADLDAYDRERPEDDEPAATRAS